MSRGKKKKHPSSQTPKEKEEQARQRMVVILQVRSGQLTATQGAALLEVSRKSYYGIERKALEGMLSALIPAKAGRPAKEVNPEKERLEQELTDAKKKFALAEAKMAIKDILYETEPSLTSFTHHTTPPPVRGGGVVKKKG